MPRNLLSLLALAALVACGPVRLDTGEGPDASPVDAAAPLCADGQMQCDGNVLSRCTAGEYAVVETCASACNAALGCVVCQPSTGTCNGDMGSACLPDGSG